MTYLTLRDSLAMQAQAPVELFHHPITHQHANLFLEILVAQKL